MPYYTGDYYRGDYYRGDPGLFSFVGKALGGVAKLAGGAIKSALGIAPPTTIVSQLPTYSQPQIQAPRNYGLINVGGGPGTGLVNIGSGQPGMPALPFNPMAGTICNVKGFHANKSTYVTRGGGTSRWPQTLQVHQRGTECVRNRRMNVGNPRALRRALRRVSGFAKLVKRSKRAISRAAAAVGVRRGTGRGRGRAAPSVRIVKAA